LHKGVANNSSAVAIHFTLLRNFTGKPSVEERLITIVLLVAL